GRAGHEAHGGGSETCRAAGGGLWRRQQLGRGTLMNWHEIHAAVWRASSHGLRAVKHLDSVRFEDLLGVDSQVAKLKQNTERFMRGQPCNHVLLWGSRGTGQSSLVKAMLNEYAPRGLRAIEVDRDDLVALPDIVDQV